MKKEIQKKLLESLELRVGDRIKVTQKNYVHTNKIFVIRETEDDYYLEMEEENKDGGYHSNTYLLSIIVDREWARTDIKKFKDLRCDDFISCAGCYLSELCHVSCPSSDDERIMTFKDYLEKVKTEFKAEIDSIDLESEVKINLGREK